MESIPIQSESIKLDQFLKWAGAVATGGEAKQWIAEGVVRVDGEVETRRGRTLYAGNVVSLQGGPTLKVTRDEG